MIEGSKSTRTPMGIWSWSQGGNWMLRGCVVIVYWTALLQAGCGSSSSANSDETRNARLTVLTKHYAAYMNTHNNQPPASEAEFKQSLTEAGGRILERAGAASLDELFVSPGDGQPFVIRYGKAATPLVRRGVIAYEKTGKGGQRFVGYRLGFVEAVDEEKFRTIVPTP